MGEKKVSHSLIGLGAVAARGTLYLGHSRRKVKPMASYFHILTLYAPKINIAEFSNSVDPPHLDLHCLPSSLKTSQYDTP